MNLDFTRNLTVEELLGRLNSPSTAEMPGSLTRDEEEPFTPDADELKSSAEILLAAGDLALARNVLLAMVRSGTLAGWALRALGRTFEQENQSTKARRAYQDAIAYESHFEAYRCLAVLEIREQNHAAAADTLERALNVRELSQKTRFEVHKACGNCWMRAQRTEKAEHHYKRALAIDPTSDQICSNLGALYLQSGRIRDAQRCFEDALVANPSNSRALAGLGAAFLAEGRKREAHDQFAKSLQLDIHQPNAIYHLVKCAYEIRSYATAARLLGDYVEIAPVNANLLYSLSGLQFHLGRIEEARTTVLKILQIQPAHAGANELSRLMDRYAVAQPEKGQK